MQNEQYQGETRMSSPMSQTPPDPSPGVARDRHDRRRDLPYKIPFLAGLLSGILPGLGQIYVGYYQAGIVLGAVFAGIITILAGGADGLEPFFGIMVGFVWLYGIIDAARRAQAVNLALDGYGDASLPPDMALPAVGGSRTGGVILMLLGVVLVLHTGFDLEMEWLEDWWPLALIGLGGWLFYKSRREQAGMAGESGSSRGQADRDASGS